VTGLFTQVTGGANPQFEPEWVDEVLLAGARMTCAWTLGPRSAGVSSAGWWRSATAPWLTRGCGEAAPSRCASRRRSRSSPTCSPPGRSALFGEHRPAVMPAPGITFREQDGELHLALPASPYLGEQDPSRWSDGWLHTRDAGTVDPQTGLVRVLGRRDSQVSVGGLSYRPWNARSRPGLPRTSDRDACTWSSSCRARPPGSSCAARLPFATSRQAARASPTPPRVPSHFPKRKR
jgi:hypothetical protein